MKSLLRTKPWVLLLLLVSCAAPNTPSSGSSAAPTLTIAQAKEEIDKTLRAYSSAWGSANSAQVTVITSGGNLRGILSSAYAAGQMPDIFVVAGPDDVKTWGSLLADLSGESWVADTSMAYVENGKVIGFPIAVEGWGLAYNADILSAAGVDPSTLNNLAAYKDAFAKIDSRKAELGLDSVVSMVAGSGVGWVTAHHNLNSYLSNGLKFGDRSVVDLALEGQVDAARLAEYSDWVGLLFQYADQKVLITGTYDDQVNAFATGKAAFLHQGNWVDPILDADKITFTAAFAPHGSSRAVTDGVFVNTPAWYVINKDSKNLELAKKYLYDLVYTNAGQRFQVVDADMIPAFRNITLKPSSQLSRSIQDWIANDKIYSWNQYQLPNDFRNNVLAPIYYQFATGSTTKAQFVAQFANAIATLKP